jgi:adenylyltransferase/sulfurtransferase
MQALEVIKIIVQRARTGEPTTTEYRPSMTMFAAFDFPQWRTFRLRGKKADCVACGDHPTITRENIQKTDYSALCRRENPVEIVERVSVRVIQA